ncbi:MAG TPA: Gfo/Idh/MocA family oxidoreductase [Sedimentisphaerales bacterium]|nr:Gfo/Idh/MocA family oxidoreductase [Phycisphaerae bacterium]HON93036.1 Gfo/Idh/MocA family oxidoreductase [Sedimentisphaerales bacterium]HQI29150.1 Gfo/Idh/MocA family oxidoreductase [Sedimentisphaerales bacterium]
MAGDSVHTMVRREFLGRLGTLSVGAMAAVGLSAGQSHARERQPAKVWQPVSDRKVRVGIVGYGVCKFGAQFGFQDHPNVEVVAVSDLIPDRRNGLMEACRCGKSYDSLEELVKDPKIEAVFVATDAPNHAKHCIEVLNHGKHVMTAVPAVFGSLEQAEQLVETVRKTGLKYMMAETSCFHESCYAMRQIYHAGGFGKLLYSEGEYYHYSPTPIPSYKEWRTGMPPLWYPTHSTAYYIGVTGKRFTSVSCIGSNAGYPAFAPGANRYNNPFSDEVALFQTSEGGVSRMLMCKGVFGLVDETGRVFGEKGYMNGMNYQGTMKDLPDLARPALPPSVDAGGHGGSHGPLMNEFVTAILQDREPMVNVYEALAMTVPGIIAHQSALKGGENLKIPQFDKA